MAEAVLEPISAAVVLGSVRNGRHGHKVAEWIRNSLEVHGHEVNLVDPKEVGLPMLEQPRHFVKKGEKAPEAVEEVGEIFTKSQAIVLCSAEYNHLPPPALLNILDHFKPEFRFKTAGIASYSVGNFGGVRAAMALRAYVSELGMLSVPMNLPVPQVHKFDPKNVSEFDQDRMDFWIEEIVAVANATRHLM